MRCRIISLNICHGGGKRIAQLARWLITKGSNVVVLPEWRNDDAGRRILEILKGSGFSTIATAQEKSKRNCVLLAANNFTKVQENTPANSPAGDLILIETAEQIRILGCYFPQGQAKAPFFRKCIEVASENVNSPLVLIGDFNTGRNDLDIEGTGTHFDCADLFIALNTEAGLTDLWRARHAKRQEWTWRSSVNGFRIDHAFGNKTFITRFPAFKCEIDHEPRLSGFTDHSAVVVEAE
jgi:exodeoxyribonuclease-3